MAIRCEVDEPLSAHARCPFEVESFAPAAWESAPPPGMELGRAALHKRFAGGDLEGTSTVEMLSMRRGDGAGTYLALEAIEGRLGGRSGTFVLQHGGTATADGGQRTWVEVVEDSGTGELTGLRGSGRIQHGLLELDYDVD